MSLKVEVFTVPWCPKCASAGQKLTKLVTELDDDTVTLRFVDVVEELDYATALGIVSTPAVAISGKLVFSGLPADSELRRTLLDHLTAQRQLASCVRYSDGQVV